MDYYSFLGGALLVLAVEFAFITYAVIRVYLHTREGDEW